MGIDIFSKVKDFFVEYPTIEEFRRNNTFGLVDNKKFCENVFDKNSPIEIYKDIDNRHIAYP